MNLLDGKSAIVTGGSRGLGRGIAEALLQAGCRLTICSRSEEQVQATAAELRERFTDVQACRADVGSEPDVAQLFRTAMNAYGRVDILVNNAGNFDGGPLQDLTLSEWNNVMDACLTGPFLCTREAFRVMQPQGGGRILNIGSISAQRARMHSAPYTSAKFGIQGFTQAAALEGRDCGIVVSCLHPGNILVERRQNSENPADAEPMMSIETVSKAAISMLTMPDDVNFLEAIVLPSRQLYLGRG